MLKVNSSAKQGFIPSNYAGEESVTFPNGLIIKFGLGDNVAMNAEKTITFETAFPNAIVGPPVVTKNGPLYTSSSGAQSVSAYSTSAFTYANGVAQDGTFNWIAIGY